MKSTPQSSDGAREANPHAPKDPHSLQETAAPLPHENDQNAQAQRDENPRRVGKQAHRDVERGLQDTDRRGGGEYQEKTQNDAHADVNSDGKSSGAKGGKR
ncbi:MAG: FIG00461112: hypothetical protein [uncultured Paraburkholderia sp.]|nr:MAG: FIG00461112: hypothetical protein [uncultured Paraburkholderia sp.]CAH2776431.1 MAG: FIG00461112: hypothetical protein [uncultured Paraburkholderia sp.]CAH2908722.1 MAG: FIG00461112: hypothetical protein [uncultured Paraburkholderia sp.]CAH2911035.1 MAG: FIG00461112: hypothetical protein [uncultured Paraburkholderia sp.]